MISLLSGEKGRKILIIGAAAVLVLLMLGTIFHTEKSTQTAPLENPASVEQSLETRLKTLLEKIDGVGEVSVLITLDRCSQQVYEKDEKTQTDESRSSTEKETVLSANKEPLPTAVIQPKVRGAAVVCSGANDPIVREKVTNAVAKALNIGVSKVYVTY